MSKTKYEFSMLSTPKCLNFYHEDWKDGDKAGVPITNYSSILFKDSLFKFFPYSEIYFKDGAGQIIDHIFFLEGLQFDCKLGYIKTDSEKTQEEKDNQNYKDYLEHSYIWSEHEINNIKPSQSISGDNVFMMISKYFYNDYPQSKVYNHENSSKKYTIGNLLKTVILPKWGIPSSKFENTISDTTGTPYVVQSNINNKEFISKLSEYAYSQNNQTSGFYTFINCNGEFYFMTIQDLMKQTPVKTYTIDLALNMMIDSQYIKDYRVRFGGVPINFDNYNRKYFTYQSDGTLVSESKNIHATTSEFDPTSKLLIRKDYIPSVNTRNTYVGIQEEENDLEFVKGYCNSFYVDSAMSYRFVIVVAFDPNCVSGKTVQVNVQKQTKNDEQATEFSGTWLICESTHIMDEQGYPYTQLVLSKPRIKIDSAHPFYNDFQA